jgi:hypothetical protein
MTIQGPDAHNYRGGINDLLGWRTKSTKTSFQEPARPQAPGRSQYDSQYDSESPQYTSTEIPTPVQLDGTGADTATVQGDMEAMTK